MYRARVYSRVCVTRALPPVGGTSFGPGGKRNIFIARPDAPITVDLAFGQASFVFGSRGNAACLSPSPTLISTGHDSYGENALIFTAPVPTLTSYGGTNTKLTAPLPTLSVTATGTALATAALAAPAGSLASGGIVSAMANASLQAPVPNLIGYGGAVCSVTTSAGTLTATGTSGGVGSIQVTVPMVRLSSAGTAQNFGGAILTAPAGKMAGTLQSYIVAPGATLTAIGSATITATYEAYALNLNHTPVPGQQQQPTDEMTRYTDFPFTHIVRYQNSYFGVAAGGLYLLEGTTDDGAEINYAVQTAKTDFGTPEKKTITYAYFGGRMGTEATITLVVGESGTETYSYTTPRGEAAQNYRQAFGRGVKSRYYAIKVEGGAALELDTLDLNVDQLTRRI